MDVILTENVLNLGRTGEKVRVADGYARNFLFPRKLAIRATSKNAKQLEHQKRIIEIKVEHEREEAKGLAGRIKGLALTFERKVGDEDKLFGSVTVRDIEASLHAEGYMLDRKAIGLDGPLKKLGVYNVAVKLHTNVESSIKVWVVAQ